MLRILVYGVLVHIVFLASIFIIYFQSPVIQGLRPQDDLPDPPAKRLVLFVADGLRAESFYRDGCARTPFMRDVILRKGVQGISHTRIPTESRPGHVAMIAGLYEDPSAVIRGWQENPVDFDSLFNRSARTYAWGSPDIMGVFKKANSDKAPHIETFSYAPGDEDFSGKTSTVQLDRWVFDRVGRFLRHDKVHQLRSSDRVVFFLHLLGLDTAGHVHKPNSAAFDRNLVAVDEGIASIVAEFNRVYDDGRTAFVFTADHGMTDAGAHGAGMPFETETPFVAWGAGLAHWRQLAPGDKPHRTQRVGDEQVPSLDIAQADAAPLMSALLGQAVPMNNFGQLPIVYMNTSDAYLAKAMRSNALQMGAQYEHLRAAHVTGSLAGWLSDYGALNAEMATALRRTIDTAIGNGHFEQATELSSEYLSNALLGIEYYQQYYQNALLAAVCLSMAGWLVFLVQTAARNERPVPDFWPPSVYYAIVLTLGLCVILFNYLQSVPSAVGSLLLLPIICWTPCKALHAWRIVLDTRTWFVLFAANVLVWTFFTRALLAALMPVLAILYVLTFRGDRNALLRRNVGWIGSCSMLGAFTLLPAIGRTSDNVSILMVGLCLWQLKSTGALLKRSRSAPFDWHQACNAMLLVVAIVLLVSIGLAFEQQTGLSSAVQLAAWTITAVALLMPLFGEPGVRRFPRIAENLCVPYALMSLSYEPLFLFVLYANMRYWMRMERIERPAALVGVDQRTLLNWRRSYLVLVYVLLSFFGTGNMASISSFDPNAVRCYVATFSPFLMAALIIGKLFVPVLLVMCASTSINVSDVPPTSADASSRSAFMVVLMIICDIMCAHFLFFVRNTGSWLDIGVSISHFVVMECTVLVLCAMEWLSRRLLGVRLLAAKTK